MDFKTFKQQNSLVDLAREHLGLDLLPAGIWQTCPSCRKKGKFKVFSNNQYKCMNPGCSLHKGGDIINLMRINRNLSFAECLDILGCTVSKSQIKTRVKTHLEEVYEHLKRNLARSPKALAYIDYRYGIKPQDLKDPRFDIGYSCNDLDELSIYGERIVFPIKDRFGYIKHFHTRDLAEDSDLRWLPTQKLDEHDPPFGDYLWNQHLYLDNEHLFLTEGISDGLALTKIGFPVVSLLSLHSHTLVDNISHNQNLKSVVVLLDNDRKNSNGVFKSWDSVIGKLLKIYQLGIKVWCCFPPYKVNIKDVNDWISAAKLDEKTFLEEVQPRVQTVIEFFLEHYWETPGKHIDLLLSLKSEKDKVLVHNKIYSEGNCVDYMQRILKSNESLLRGL